MQRDSMALPRCPGNSATSNRRVQTSGVDYKTYETYTLYAGILLALMFGVCCIVKAVIG